jgi:hypothetical protein
MALPSSYKQVVEVFRELASTHQAVKQFGIGQVSDIDIQTEENAFQRFPLVFLVPALSQMDRFGKVVLGFRMVVCDIAKDNEEEVTVNTQNNTFMIIQDLLSKIILTGWDTVGITVQTPVNLIPFQEKFNNNLTGWEAQLSVIVQSPFNYCAAPFV